MRFLLVCEVFGELESFSDTLAICQQSIEFDAKDEDKVEARLNQVIFFIMTFQSSCMVIVEAKNMLYPS